MPRARSKQWGHEIDAEFNEDRYEEESMPEDKEETLSIQQPDPHNSWTRAIAVVVFVLICLIVILSLGIGLVLIWKTLLWVAAL